MFVIMASQPGLPPVTYEYHPQKSPAFLRAYENPIGFP